MTEGAAEPAIGRATRPETERAPRSPAERAVRHVAEPAVRHPVEPGVSRATERPLRPMLAVIGLALGACQSTAVQAEQAAWIAAPSPESRAELLSAVRTLVGEREIRLAQDALTTTHVLLLEPAVTNRIDGRVLGRNLEKPARLELVLSDRRCYLVHAESGERVWLRQTPCVPAPASPPG